MMMMMMMMMVMNSSQVSFFTLSAYTDTGLFRYPLFLVVLLLYVLIVAANVALVVVICVNRSLHEPMYMFLCSLFVNELYGSTGLFPFLLVQILSDLHSVPAPFCFLQIFLVYSFGSVEFTNLAVMSYDRYLAICYPLQYAAHMTSRKVAFLVAVIWLPPFVAVGVTTCLSASLRFCGVAVDKVYCENYSVVKLSCVDTRLNNVYELAATCLTVCVPGCVIVYTYVMILRVCLSGSRKTRLKAATTCAPHLASVLNFSSGAFFEILQSRFEMSSVPGPLRVFLSLYFLTCPPLFNPVMYGLNVSEIRRRWKRLLQDVTSTKHRRH